MISSGVLCRELIGRASELRFLLDHVRAGRGRHGAGVVIRGDAGIGKTRLVDEVVRAARAEGFVIAAGSTREYANAPYAALAEALGSIGVELPAATDENDGGAKMRRFTAIAGAVAAAAAGSPSGLLIVVEDLHWADVGTLELLRFLASRLGESGATFVATYRSDDIDADSARARAIAALEHDVDAVVTLDPLSAKQIEALLKSAIRDGARGLAPDVVAEVRDLSDGRPLFAEELLRGVFERLDRDARAEPSVPASVRVTVRERFASLSDTDRTILLHAAVIGRRFSARFVASFANEPLGAVYAALRRARDLQLVVERDDPDGDAFAFRHALTREAVYDELLRAEARLMHGRIADALASEAKPDAAAIADHLRRSGDDAAAASWSERAADEAYAVYAYGDAARAYERAYRLTADAPARALLAERAADSWYALGDLELAVEWFGCASEACRTAGDARRAWRLALRASRVLFEGGRYDAALREADSLAQSDVDPALRFEAELMVAGLLTVHGRPVEALERLERAEQRGVPSEPFLSARFAATYAIALGYVGRPDAARPRFHIAIDEARSAGDDDQVLRTLNNWANVELACGTLERAGELYAEAFAGAERTHNARIMAWTSQNLALYCTLAGDFPRARDMLARAARIEHGVSLLHRWSTALQLRLDTLQAHEGAGEIAAAQAALDAAIADVDLSSIAMLAASLAYRFAAEHRLAEAAGTVARGIARLERAEPPYWLLDAASRFGDAASRERARALLAGAAASDAAQPARGMLAMLDAREALRRRRRDACTALASDAARSFRAAGWILDEAHALELAGNVAEALAIFRRIGAVADVRRTMRGPDAGARRRGEATLTSREREVASLVAAGYATRAIAETLVISERTVETHIAAVYRKLGVSNRRALETMLAESATPT